MSRQGDHASTTFRRRLEADPRMPPWLIVAIGLPVAAFVFGAPVWFASDVGEVTSTWRGGRRFIGIESNVTNWGLAASLLVALAIWLVGVGLWERLRHPIPDAELIADAEGIWIVPESDAGIATQALGLGGADQVVISAGRSGLRAATRTVTGVETASIASPHRLDPADTDAIRAAVAVDGRFVGITSAAARRPMSFPRGLRGARRVAAGVGAALLALVIIATQELSSGFLEPVVDIGDVEVDLDIAPPDLGPD